MGIFEKKAKRVRVHVYLDQQHQDGIQKIAQGQEVSAAEVHREALTRGLQELRIHMHTIMAHRIYLGIFEKKEKRVRVHVYLDQKHQDEIQQIAQGQKVSAAEVHREALKRGLQELRIELRPRQKPSGYDAFGRPVYNGSPRY